MLIVAFFFFFFFIVLSSVLIESMHDGSAAQSKGSSNFHDGNGMEFRVWMEEIKAIETSALDC